MSEVALRDQKRASDRPKLERVIGSYLPISMWLVVGEKPN